MTHVVLDTSAMIAYLRDEPGGGRVRQVLTGSGYSCSMHAANAIELYYKTAEHAHPDLARVVYDGLGPLGITIHESMHPAFQLRCGALKTVFPALSLADTMALALAEILGAVVLTTDKQFTKAAHLVRVEQLR